MILDEFDYTNPTKYRGTTAPEVKKFHVPAGEQPPSSLDETLKNIQSNNALRLWLDKDSPAMFYYLSDSGKQSFPYKKQKDTGKPHTNKPMTAFLKKIRQTIDLSTLGGALHDIHRISIQRPLAPAQVLYLYTTPDETEKLLREGPAIISRLAEEARAEGQSYDNKLKDIPKGFDILQHALPFPETDGKFVIEATSDEVSETLGKFEIPISIHKEDAELSETGLILSLDRKFLMQSQPPGSAIFSGNCERKIIDFLDAIKADTGIKSLYCLAQDLSHNQAKYSRPCGLNLAIYCDAQDWPTLERYMGTLENMARDVKAASAISGGLAR